LGFFLGTLSLYTSRLLHVAWALFSESGAVSILETFWLACMALKNGINGFAGSDEDC
jgi:hypothetical protein